LLLLLSCTKHPPPPNPHPTLTIQLAVVGSLGRSGGGVGAEAVRGGLQLGQVSRQGVQVAGGGAQLRLQVAQAALRADE
jgi:hypothetical protein